MVKKVKSKNIKLKIKKGDEIIVVAGKDKGKRGSVLAVRYNSDGKSRVLVEGVNMVKKHVKPNPQAEQPGGIQEKEAYINIANIKLFNSTANKGDRVGYRLLEDGKKVRYFKSTDDVVDVG